MSKPQREWRLGAHRAWFEEPDVLWQQYRGQVSLDEVRWSLDVYREVFTSYGPFYAAIDVTGAEVSAEGRRYMVEHTPTEWGRGIVYIGAGFIQKAITKSFMVGFLFGRKLPLDIEYADSPEGARAWVERHRARKPRP